MLKRPARLPDLPIGYREFQAYGRLVIELRDLDFRPLGKDNWAVYDRRLKKRLGWMRLDSDGTYSVGGEGAMFAGPRSGAVSPDEAAEVFLGYE